MFEFADCKLLEMELRQLTDALNTPLVQGCNPHFDVLKELLEQYFKEERKHFDIPMDLAGTEFQKQVWLSLLKIHTAVRQTMQSNPHC